MLINISIALLVKCQSMVESLKLDECNGRLLNSWHIWLLLGARLLLHVTVRRCRSFLVSVKRRRRRLWVKKSVVRFDPLFKALSAVVFVRACTRIIPFSNVVLPVVIRLTGTALVSFFEYSPTMPIVEWSCLHSLLFKIIKLLNLFFVEED